MDRTAEEFVHQLPSGRWFVGDFVRTNPDGQEVILVEIRRWRAVELTTDVIARPATGIVSYGRKSSAKRAAQKMIERVLDDSEPRGSAACVCGGLGAYVDWNGSTVHPAYEVRACSAHPLAPNEKELVEQGDAAAMRVEECLHAIADLRDILWPGGDPEASWSPDTAEAIGRRLAFLAPQGGE
jgi:hypothetical protein